MDASLSPPSRRRVLAGPPPGTRGPPPEGDPQLGRRLHSKRTRALTAEWTPDAGVHFHGGAHGPYPCHDPRCTSPGLDLDER